MERQPLELLPTNTMAVPSQQPSAFSAQDYLNSLKRGREVMEQQQQPQNVPQQPPQHVAQRSYQFPMYSYSQPEEVQRAPVRRKIDEQSYIPIPQFQPIPQQFPQQIPQQTYTMQYAPSQTQHSQPMQYVQSQPPLQQQFVVQNQYLEESRLEEPVYEEEEIIQDEAPQQQAKVTVRSAKPVTTKPTAQMNARAQTKPPVRPAAKPSTNTSVLSNRKPGLPPRSTTTATTQSRIPARATSPAPLASARGRSASPAPTTARGPSPAPTTTARGRSASPAPLPPKQPQVNYQQKYDEAVLEINSYRQQLEISGTQIQQINKMLLDMDVQNESHLREVENLKIELEAKLRLVAEYERRLKDLELSYKQSETDAACLRDINKRIDSERIELQVKIKNLEYQLEKEQKEHRMELTTVKSNLEAELQSQKTTYELQLEDLRQQTAKSSRQLKEDLTREISGLRNQFETTKTDLDFSEQTSETRRKRLEETEKQLAKAVEQIKELEAKRQRDEIQRRKLHNQIQELKGNIRVYCRVRPLLPKEVVDASNPNSAFVLPHISFPKDEDEKSIDIVGEAKTGATGNDITQKYAFQFDKVFKPESKQEYVFEEISQLVQSALDGYKVCIFAYGQTGSGKTFTMEGNGLNTSEEDHRGMIPRSVEQIFTTAKYMREQGWEYSIEASFLEIYNENLRDLLSSESAVKDKNSSSSSLGLPLDIKHDASNNTTVTGLTTVSVTRPGQVYELLKTASKNRKVAATECNERSSRSHSVFTLKIIGRNSNTQQQTQGVLNLIDLAGSERLSQSKSTGDRMTETKHINSSLSCLGDVINALATKSKHVPFRNSKLTYLLQNSLGGDSKTLMFVNISPLQQNAQETICSLRFAAKVNACDIGTAKRKITSLN